MARSTNSQQTQGVTSAAGADTIIAYAPAGASNLNQGIQVPTSSGVYSSAGNVTMNYYII